MLTKLHTNPFEFFLGRPQKIFFHTLVLYLYYVSVLQICKRLLLERLRVTFTPNGKRELVPRDQVSPYCYLLFITSTQS